MRSLLEDSSGAASATLLSFTPLWFVIFGAFLMNVQLNRNYIQRDVVDHAVALAADAASKTVCADEADLRGSPGDLEPSRSAAVRAAIRPVLDLVTRAPRDCGLTLRRGASPTGAGAGAMPLDVELVCEFACDVPIAAQAMCAGSPRHVVFAARQSTVAMGCDVARGGG